MSEREKLIAELESMHEYGVAGMLDSYIVADFILADRKRIVDPLVEANKLAKQSDDPIKNIKELCKACNETLQRAGVSHE